MERQMVVLEPTLFVKKRSSLCAYRNTQSHTSLNPPPKSSYFQHQTPLMCHVVSQKELKLSLPAIQPKTSPVSRVVLGNPYSDQ